MRISLRFRVGSVSKTVVAALVLKLVADGRLPLSDTVAHWLPGRVPDGRQITVADLLEHRSGLAGCLNTAVGLMTSGRHLGRLWTSRQLLGLIARDPLWFAPGTRFSYASTDDLVLGMIIGRVTHMPLQRYTQRILFGPLGMHSTSFALGHLSGRYAHGYMPTVGPLPAAPGGLGDTERLNGSEYSAAASLVSTAADLDRFFHALLPGRIIPRSLVALIQATRPGEAGPDYQSYGVGLEGSRYACGPAWGHGGNIWGYRAVVRASRTGDRLIVLLVNFDYDALMSQLDTTVSRLYCGT
jgi:D-alanyl-D-alanine carboxypeptidase